MLPLQGERGFHPCSGELRSCMLRSAAYSPPPHQKKKSLRSKCCHVLLILLLTITLEGNVFNPCSQMRKVKLSGDGNLPVSRRGSMKRNDPLPRGKIFCGANSDIVSNACCLITFPSMWTLPLHAKTKSLHLLSQILSGHSPWFLTQVTDPQWRLPQVLLVVWDCIFFFFFPTYCIDGFRHLTSMKW